MEKNRSAIVDQILREIHRLDPTLEDKQIRLLSQQFLAGDEEALLFLFLEILRRVNQSTPFPSTPSGMIHPHLKASAQTGNKPRRKKNAGGQKGHPDYHRRHSDLIDRREEHRLDRCPNCGGLALKRIFDEAFEGILVTDFWAACDAILGGLHQCRLFHLLNELVKVDHRHSAAE